MNTNDSLIWLDLQDAYHGAKDGSSKKLTIHIHVEPCYTPVYSQWYSVHVYLYQFIWYDIVTVHVSLNLISY